MTYRANARMLLLVLTALSVLVSGTLEAALAEPAAEARYPGVSLARSDLSLSDDTPIWDVDAGDEGRGFVGGGSTAAPAGEKNPMVALLLSCVVPGWGEIYAGETTRGRWFMASEVAIWSGYGAFRVQEGMRRDDYEEYAQVFADVPSNADSDYLSDIADFIRSDGDDSYNESIRREARSLYPNDLEAQAAYLRENGYFGEESWDWGTRDSFYEYRVLRQSASRSKRNAFFMTGLALLNRALSAVDSAWMVRRHNDGLGDPSVRLTVAPEFGSADVGARATLEVSF